jgi:hypothetical protein
MGWDVCVCVCVEKNTSLTNFVNVFVVVQGDVGQSREPWVLHVLLTAADRRLFQVRLYPARTRTRTTAHAPPHSHTHTHTHTHV